MPKKVLLKLCWRCGRKLILLSCQHEVNSITYVSDLAAAVETLITKSTLTVFTILLTADRPVGTTLPGRFSSLSKKTSIWYRQELPSFRAWRPDQKGGADKYEISAIAVVAEALREFLN